MKKTVEIKVSDLNHLRRLIGYVRCNLVGLVDAEEYAEIVKDLAAHGIYDGKPEEVERVREKHLKLQNIPKYVRDAMKALEKTVYQHDGAIDAELVHEVDETKMGMN